MIPVSLPWKIALLLCSCVLIAPSPASAQMIWQETFSGYANGTQNSARWTTSFGDCDIDDSAPFTSEGAFWGVQSGRFRVNDIEGTTCIGPRGDNQNFFTTEVIDLSGEACVDLSVEVSSNGPLECNFFPNPWPDVIPGINGHDQLVIQYQVDGGPWTIFPVDGYFCGSGSGTARAEDIRGNNLRIRIVVGNQGNDENYYFDNIQVRSNTRTYDIPDFDNICVSSGNLSLPVAPDGISGNWSGPGVSGNTFRPTVAGPGTHLLTFTPTASRCALPSVRSITVAPQAAFDPVPDQTACGGYVLPPVQGTTVPANTAYYTEPDGKGTRYVPGDTVFSSGPLYIFGGTPGCTDQVSFQVNAASSAQLNRPGSVSVCGYYVLPPVSGNALQGPTGYSTLPQAQGTILSPGDTVRQSGRYYLFDGVGECRVQDSFSLTVHRLSIQLRQTDSVLCAGDSSARLEVDVVEGRLPAQYTWSTPDVPDEAFAQNLPAGDYSVTVTDQNACTDVAFATIPEPLPLHVVCDSSNDVTVPRGSNGSIPFRYFGGTSPYRIYLTGPVVDSAYVDTAGLLSFTNLRQGDYQVLVIDQNNCARECFFSLDAPPCNLDGNPVVVQPACAGEQNGRITLTPTGGTMPYRYDWSVDSLDGQAFAQNLTAGQYTLTVTGSNGCAYDTTLTLTAPLPLTLTCSYDSTSAILDLQGGRLPYTIVYQGPATDTVRITDRNGLVSLPDLLPGDYSITVFDSSGCTARCNLLIPNPACALAVTIDAVPESCPNAGDGQLNLRTTGGVQPLRVTWADGVMDSLRTDLAAGTYTVQVEDGLGCRHTESMVLETAHPTPAYQLDTSGRPICADGCDTISLRAVGAGPYQANLAIRGIDSMVVRSISFSEEGNTTSGRVRLPVCLPALGLQADTLFYTVTAFTDAHCPTDTVQQAQTPIVALDTAQLDTLICPQATVTIGSTLFDRFQPQGVVVFPGAATTGCDSFLSVALQFRPTDTLRLTPTLCHSDTLLVNGTAYSRARPAGLERLPGMAANGCDSLIAVDASFLAEKRDTLAPLICRTDTLTVNGRDYFFGESQGIETLSSVGVPNCDSIVVVDLQFYPADTVQLDTLLCAGDSLLINGNRYDQFTPSGTEVFKGRRVDGCDSVVQVQATFLLPDTTEVAPRLCFGDSLIIGGERFDATRPSGQVVFARSAEAGCDSTVMVNLRFRESRDTLLRTTLCPEESLVVNGTTYDLNRPQGTELVAAGAQSGCDSTIQVQLQFFPVDTGVVQAERCADQSYSLFGETFTPQRPRGTIRLPAASQHGCDSLIVVDISFARETPGLDLPSEIVVRQGDSVVLDPRYNFTPSTVRWTSDPLIAIPAVPRPVFIPTQNLDIRVEASNSAGCEATATTRIILDRRLQVYTPNVFRPGAGGANGGFTLFGGNQIQEIEILRIFDRWGNLLFTVRNIPPNTPSLGWDGRASGRDMPGGLYVYSATLRLRDGRQEVVRGDVLLIR